MRNVTNSLKIRFNKRDTIMFLFMLYIICFADGLVCRNLFQTTFQWSFIILTVLVLARERTFDGEYLKLVFVAAIMLIGMFLIGNVSGAWFFKISLFAFSIYISKIITLEEFNNYLRKFMMFIIIVNLIFFVLYVLGVPLDFLPKVTNGRGSSFYTIFIANLPVNRAASFMTKMRGPFWEPGPFASYLCFSLALELFIAKSKNIKYIVMVIVALAFTFSTTGYLTFALILGAFVFSKNKQTDRTWMKISVIILIILTIALMTFSETVNDTLFGKIYTENESYKGRVNCFFANLMIIREHPILGVGVAKSNELIEQYMRSLGSIRSLSNLNTILSNFTMFGLACGLYYIVKVVKFCLDIGNTLWSRLMLLLATFIILSCFGFQYSPFFNVIFFLRNRTESNSSTQKTLISKAEKS